MPGIGLHQASVPLIHTGPSPSRSSPPNAAAWDDLVGRRRRAVDLERESAGHEQEPFTPVLLPAAPRSRDAQPPAHQFRIHGGVVPRRRACASSSGSARVAVLQHRHVHAPKSFIGSQSRTRSSQVMVPAYGLHAARLSAAPSCRRAPALAGGRLSFEQAEECGKRPAMSGADEALWNGRGSHWRGDSLSASDGR